MTPRPWDSAMVADIQDLRKFRAPYVQPVRVAERGGVETAPSDDAAEAFSVYALDAEGFSEWLADFPNRAAAEAYCGGIAAALVAMGEA